jgi:hypothetical protein
MFIPIAHNAQGIAAVVFVGIREFSSSLKKIAAIKLSNNPIMLAAIF